MPTVADDAINSQQVNQQLASSTGDARFWQLRQQQNVAGADILLERERASQSNMSKTIDASLVQEVNGTDPTLATFTEALRSARDQPQTTGALINPGVVQGQPGTGGTGANPAKAGTATS